MTPTLMARNSTGVTRSIGVSPYPRERINIPGAGALVVAWVGAGAAVDGTGVAGAPAVAWVADAGAGAPVPASGVVEAVGAVPAGLEVAWSSTGAIQSTSPASAVTPSSEKATTAAHRAHPRRRSSP